MDIKTNNLEIRNRMKKHKNLNVNTSFGCEIIDETELGTETEAERQIKLLLEKQLNTKVTLKECLAQKKEFANSSKFTPLTELIQGACTLEKYKEVESKEERRQELQRCGLSEEEIALYLAHSGGDSTCSRKRAYHVEPSIANEKLKEVNQKIALHQKELENVSSFSGVKVLSRHAMDIERTLYAGCGPMEKIKKLVIEQSQSSSPINDPYTHVKELSLKLVKNAYRKQKKFTSGIKKANYCSTESHSEFMFDPSVHHVIVPLDEQEVCSKKLSIEDIRKNPKFKDYEPGIPNKVLFLKNLHPNVNIRELQALFSRFVNEGDSYIDYRILSGRMKGQAFLTFPDVHSAKSALQFANGYILRERPIIIEYGKRK